MPIDWLIDWLMFFIVDAIVMVGTTNTNIEADVGKYYKCDSNTNIKVNNATTSFSDMMIQPFYTNATKVEGRWIDIFSIHSNLIVLWLAL